MSEITPALTAEDWAKQDYTDSCVSAHILFGTTREIQIFVPDGPVMCCLTPEESHGIAAVLLHRQPFGFTREDVDMIRRLAKDVRNVDPTQARSLKLFALAERIAALLPPGTG